MKECKDPFVFLMVCFLVHSELILECATQNVFLISIYVVSGPHMMRVYAG